MPVVVIQYIFFFSQSIRSDALAAFSCLNQSNYSSMAVFPYLTMLSETTTNYAVSATNKHHGSSRNLLVRTKWRKKNARKPVRHNMYEL